MLKFRTRLEFKTAEQCEQFQMMAFGVSCATCQRSDRECPWNRQDELTVIAKLTKTAPVATLQPQQARGTRPEPLIPVTHR
jgi:hypothetical protein